MKSNAEPAPNRAARQSASAYESSPSSVPADVAALVARLRHARAGGADNDTRGHVDRDVVRAEIRVKLGQMVKWEVTPFAVRLEPRDLREPLRDHVEIAGVARALDD